MYYICIYRIVVYLYSGIYLNMLVTKFITLYIQRTHFSCAHLLLLECAIKSKLIRVLLLLLYHIHIYWMCVCVLWFYSDQYIASHASTYYILNICYISMVYVPKDGNCANLIFAPSLRFHCHTHMNWQLLFIAIKATICIASNKNLIHQSEQDCERRMQYELYNIYGRLWVWGFTPDVGIKWGRYKLTIHIQLIVIQRPCVWYFNWISFWRACTKNYFIIYYMASAFIAKHSPHMRCRFSPFHHSRFTIEIMVGQYLMDLFLFLHMYIYWRPI